MLSTTLSSFGAHDTGSYGVFVINEQNYMWKNNDESTVKSTATALQSYLDQKLQVAYGKPIFVVSHLPLHYSMRTKNDGDGQYANYLFDVLNTAAASGLNIFFLYGHDHSNGWDDYLGGSAVYLKKGDSINIAQASKTAFKAETLNFTYLNAGYVGYYNNCNTGAETDLTMTLFEITDTDVKISRYSADGLHDLKSAGVRNAYKSETAYEPNTTVYVAPQTVVLDQPLTGGTYTATGIVPGYAPIHVTSLTPGTYYVIKAYEVDWMLSGNVVPNVDGNDSLELVDVSPSLAQRWYYDGTHLRCGDDENGYLAISTHMANLQPLGTSNEARSKLYVYPNNDGQTISFRRQSVNYYLYQYGGNDSPHAAGFSQTDGSVGDNGKWYFYALGDGEVNVSVVASKTSMTMDQIAKMTPYVTVEGVDTTDYTLSWSVEDPNIATVDENGVVQALRLGKTNIVATVTEVNGYATNETITVKIPLNVYMQSMGSTVVSASGWVYCHLKPVTSWTTGVPSGPYVISSAYKTDYKNLSSKVVDSTLSDGKRGLELVSGDDLSYVWYYDGRYFKTPKGDYLTFSNGIVTISTSNATAFDTVTPSKTLGQFLIKNSHVTNNSNCLNQQGGPARNNVALWNDGDWIISEITPGQAYLTVTPGSKTLAVETTTTLATALTVDDVMVANHTVNWYTDNPLVATVEDGKVTAVSAGVANITAVLTTVKGSSRVSDIAVTVPITVVNEASDSNTAYATGVVTGLGTEHVENLVARVPSGPYVIAHPTFGYVVSGNENFTSKNRTGLELLKENDFNHLWYYDGTHFRYGAIDGEYLAVENGQVCLSRNEEAAFDSVVFKTGSSFSGYLIGNSKVTDTKKYLNQLGGQSDDLVAGLYTDHISSAWHLLAVPTDKSVTLSVTPGKTSIESGAKLTLKTQVQVGNYATESYNIDWYSSDSTVATVSDGVVTGVDGGMVTITAHLTQAGGADCDIKAEIIVNVIKTEHPKPSWGKATTSLGVRPVQVTDLPKEGISGPYLITNFANGSILTGYQYVNSTAITGLWLRQNIANDYNDLWYYDGTHLIYGDPNATDRYLVHENGIVGLGSDLAHAYDNVVHNSNRKQAYSISASSVSGKYLNQYSNLHAVYHYGQESNDSSAWNFYELIYGVEIVLSGYTPDSSTDLLLTESKKVDHQLLLNGAVYKNYTVSFQSSDPYVAEVSSDGTVYPQSPGTVTISVRLESMDGAHPGVNLVAPVTLNVKGVQSVGINTKEGSLPLRASQRMQIGATTEGGTVPMMSVTFEEGTVKEVPLTVAHLTDRNGNKINTFKDGVYENLTVTYMGVFCCDDFTLHILPRHLPDYPEYPNEGSIDIDKTASDTQHFQSSGLSQVELSVNGVPSKKGVDVIIMVDTSSSMDGGVADASDNRLNVLCQSLNNLINSFQETAADGSILDISVAVADFNGFYHDEHSPYYIDPKDTMSGSSIRIDSDSGAQVYTGKTLTSEAFIPAKEMGLNPFTTNSGYKGVTSGKYILDMDRGTNYDYALDAVYQLGQSINDHNVAIGEDRDLYVIFMSDGAPYQYNYFSSQSQSLYWNKYLMGQMEDSMFAENADRSYYHEDGKHWMAEAIKGDRDQMYPVIRKNDASDTNGDNWIEVEGLGATMYSIGFCLVPDNDVTVESMEHVIRQIASSDDLSYIIDTAEQLESTFKTISNDVMYAASEAYFVDTIGNAYNLKLGDHSYTYNGSTVTFTENQIEIRTYEIYTLADFEADACLENQIGVRKTDENGKFIYQVSETVTFNATGTEAYSSLISNGNTNILKDGVICAKNFWYNSNSTAKNITLSGGKTYSLPAETFYWDVGTISTKEKALNYFVYLDKSLDGDVKASVYNTNESAILYYTNYLGNTCYQEKESPSMTWKHAQVGYGFYLVNKTGKPVVNQTSGQTGSFEMSVKLGNTIYREFNTNSAVPLFADQLLPEELANEYRLFDLGARYDVNLESDGAGYIDIYANGNVPVSTYVTGLKETAIKGDANNDGLAQNVTHKDYTNFATANTVVWFAVVVNDDMVVADKTVDTIDGKNDEFTLTLVSYSTGEMVKKPTNEPVDSAKAVALDGTTVLKDVLSDYFELANQSDLKSNISVYTAQYDGKDKDGNDLFSNELVPYDNAVVDVVRSKDGRYDTVNVSNFDYSTEFIRSFNGKSSGRKLVVKINVKVRDGFWGGNNVPTNDSDAAIYTPELEQYAAFPIPQVNVTPTVVVKTMDQVVYYNEPTLNTYADLTQSITVDGVPVTFDDNRSLTPQAAWMDDYAELTWKNFPTVYSTNVADYGLTVILKPKSGRTGTANTTGKSNIAGTPISAGGIASETVWAHVEVLVPLVTLQDSTVWIGKKMSRGYLETNNLVKQNEKDFQWINMADPYGTAGKRTTATMGTEPSVTLGYESMAGTTNYFDLEMPWNINVHLNGTVITPRCYFEWIPCEANHKADQIIVDSVANDAFHRHRGDVDSYEFYVHVKELKEDTVVIDFGLPVDINVLGNDDLPDDGDLVGVKAGTSAPFSDQIDAQISDSAVSEHGKLTTVEKCVRYEPTDMELDDADVFTYGVILGSEDRYIYTTVTVIPAATIYYEDNADGIKYHADKNLAIWDTEGTAGNLTQDQDRPGTADEYLDIPDADNVYGYDSHYASTSTYSNGSVSYVKLTEEKNVARASFTFTGTGFDIISLCNSDTTAVMVNVFEGADNIDFDSDMPLATYFVDTWYQTGNDLYQVPVIKADLTKVQMSKWDSTLPQYDEKGNIIGYGDYRIWDEDLGYGTYTVELYVSTTWLNPEATDFYLDAIRIYNPAGVGDFKNAVTNELIQDTYQQDREGWPVYQELRDMFISQKKLGTETTNGIIFIDGKSENVTLADYIAWGPNNEVYLNPLESIAFTLDVNNSTNVDSIHVGMRGFTKTSQVKIQEEGALYPQVHTTMGTTDMYYSISKKSVGKVIVITNSGDSPIAISNIKITHTSAPEREQTFKMFRADMRTAEIALEILNAEQLVDPVVTPKRPALSFNGMVCYNVFFTAEELGALTAEDLGLAVFSTEDTEGTVETAKDVIYGATKIGEEYMVATNGVHAKYLGDKQYFRAFAKKADGTYVYSKMVSYSALDYAKNALAKSDDVKLKQLVVAMLNYGAEAQKFFGYKTDDLMNATLTADDQALLAGFDATSLNAVGKVDASKVGAFASTGGFSKRSPAISFKGAFEINYFMTPANAVDGDMTLYFWNEDTYNAVGELTAQNADKAVTMTLENGTYSASSDEIAARYLDQTVYVAAVYESNGVRYCSGVLPYSIAAYCQKPPAGVQALATAATIYGCTAKVYFGG